MKVINHLSKFLKPSKPTSTINRYYKLSMFDELAPTMNAPLILYYNAPPDHGSNRRFGNISDHLEDTLSKTLSEFYPMAGRYIRKDSLIDCNDQGALYIKSKANVQLKEILGLRNGSDPGLLNEFLPCEIGKADEVDDPMLSVKSTTFECGGFAIGMCISHRLFDMGNVCNFINNWAARSSNEEHKNEKYSPLFNLTKQFPQRGLPELDLRIPRSSVGIDKKARKFLFKGEAISAMRKNVGFDENDSRKPSKVQLVVALLWKAFVHADQANNGRSKASFLVQPVNLRDKLVPELCTNSFGNCYGLATSRIEAGEGEKMNLEDYFKICRDSVSKTVKDSANLVTHGEEGYGVVIDPSLESRRNMENKDVNFYLFTSWCKFSYYGADFGCGKPVWASTGKLPVQNSAILMDDDEGDGVEAMVYLDEKRMKLIEQDADMKAYAI